MKLQVLHEDNHLLAVMKPAGLLVQGDRSGDPTLLDLAAAYLKQKYDKPGDVYLGLVHRLDRNVSGVVLLARTSKAAGRLSQQFRQMAVSKTYLAVVEGIPRPAVGDLEAWLAQKGNAQGKTRAEWTEFENARRSLLAYRVLEARQGLALVQVFPSTGRRHQIRAQFALAGWSLLGDVKYGARGRLPHRRIALHAEGLAVRHPIGGAPLKIVTPPPGDWPWPPGTGQENRP